MKNGLKTYQNEIFEPFLKLDVLKKELLNLTYEGNNTGRW